MRRSTRVTIIRHGESQCTVDGIVGGTKGCTGLSMEGRRQAELLRDRLLQTGELAITDVVLTSVLPRAIETAAIISPAVGGGNLDVLQDCDLCELHPGECDGMTWTDYSERYGHIDMRADPYAAISPGGESVAGFVVRVGGALRRAVDRYEGQQIVIVAHGGVIQSSFRAFGNLPIQAGIDIEPSNTSLTEWAGVRGEDGTYHWLLVRYNDFAHLSY
jgi:probable phosphoglycerate mutase